jgi:uncharacterized protein YbjT (DUF2867 family)
VHAPEKVGSVYEGCSEVRVADFRDERDTRDAFVRIDELLLTTPTGPDQTEVGERLVEAAGSAGVRRIVKLSVMDADLEPATLVRGWHREMELAIERSGIPFTFLRPNAFMQNMAGSWGAGLSHEGRFTLPAGDGAVSWIDARDVALAGVEVLLADAFAGRALTLTGPEAITYRDVAAIISDVAGRRVEYVDVPEETARERLRKAGIPEPTLSGILEVWAVQKAGGASLVTTDFADATGVAPRGFGAFARAYRRAWTSPSATAGPGGRPRPV